MRGKLVVGNWKMNGGLAANAALLDGAGRRLDGRRPDRQLAVCVPFPYLAQARDALAGTPIAWGAQDVERARVGRVHRRGVGAACSPSSAAAT